MIYIDADTCAIRDIGPKVTVRLNGRKMTKVTRAKHGKNGFVEYYPDPMRIILSREEIVTKKVRGNVKISFNLWDRIPSDDTFLVSIKSALDDDYKFIVGKVYEIMIKGQFHLGYQKCVFHCLEGESGRFSKEKK